METKKILEIHMVLKGLGAIVPTMLVLGFSLLLFEQDPKGISAAYLEPACLLGMGCAGIFGVFVLRHFSPYVIGITSLLMAATTLLALLLYDRLDVQICTIVLLVIACIMNIEHANGLAFISRNIDMHQRPVFFSSFQVVLQCFNILAPICTKYLLKHLGYSVFLITCIFIYILRMLPWILLQAKARKDGFQEQPMLTASIFTGCKEIVGNLGLRYMTSFRLINHISIAAYTISLPILVARIANGVSDINATLHSNSIVMINLGFILSGLCGSLILKRRPQWIIYFFKISPFFVMVAAISVPHIMSQLHLLTISLFYGIGLYLSRTAISIIGQALTKKETLSCVILTGDAIVKFLAYGIGSFIPHWLVMPALWGVVSPFVGCALCSLGAMTMIKPIVRTYLGQINPKKSACID